VHSRIILTGTAAALLAVAACSGPVDGRATPMSVSTSSSAPRGATSSTTAPSSGASLHDIDPCELLSRGEAEQVAGPLREGPTRRDLGTARGCEFMPARGIFAIDLRENVGLAGVQAAGEVTDLMVGEHQAKNFLGAGGSCFVVLGITESSRVDVVVNPSVNDGKPCPSASRIAEVIEPKLP
jgi:Protein of unknown function (DUF3558)